MFLSKLFRHTRAKVLTALAGLTMIFGVGATISTVAATQQNDVVETKASYEDECYGYNTIDQTSGSVTIMSIESISFEEGYSHALFRLFMTDYFGSQKDWTAHTGSMPTTAGWSYMSGSEKEKYLVCPSGAKSFTFRIPAWVSAISVKFVGNNWSSWAGYQSTGNAYSLTKNSGKALYINSSYQIWEGDSWGETKPDWTNETVTKHYYFNGSQIGTNTESKKKYVLYSPNTEVYDSKLYEGWFTNSGRTTAAPLFVTSAAKDVYANGIAAGYYAAGDSNFKSGSNWESWTAVPMETTAPYSAYASQTVSAGAQFRIFYFDGTNSTKVWKTMTPFNCATGVSKSGNNISISSAGTYEIYFDDVNTKITVRKSTDTTTFTVYFRIICNNVLQDQLGYFYGTVNYPNTFDEIANCHYDREYESKMKTYDCSYGSKNLPTIPGYEPSGWYAYASFDSFNSRTRWTRISDSKVPCSIAEGDTYKVYLRYVTASSSETIFYDTMGNGSTDYTSDIVGSCGYVYYCVSSDGKTVQLGDTMWPGIRTGFVKGFATMFTFVLPSDAEFFILNSNTEGDAHQTIDVPVSGRGEGDNLYSINGVSGSMKKGDWTQLNFKMALSTSNTFPNNASTTRLNMSVPSAAKGNKNEAEILKVDVTSSMFGRIEVWYANMSGETPTVEMKHSYATLGSTSLAFANQSASTYFKFKGTYTLNIYLSHGDQKIYMVNAANLDNYGYLYLASHASANAIHLTTMAGSDAQRYDEELSSLDSVVSWSGLTFEGFEYIHKIPVYDMRGDDDSDTTSIVFNTDSASWTVTPLTHDSGTDDDYYIKEGVTVSLSSISATTNDAFMHALQTTLNVLDAITSNSYFSICKCTTDQISAFTSGYATASTTGGDSFAALKAATIKTWDGSAYNLSNITIGGPNSTQNDDVTMLELYTYINTHYNASTGKWSLGVFNPKGTAESPLTTTLWIVLGAGVLGLGAIGTAYFVSKKKEHQA